MPAAAALSSVSLGSSGYNPAQDRIVDLWDAQRHELAIEAEEETSREEETAEVATTLRARRS